MKQRNLRHWITAGGRKRERLLQLYTLAVQFNSSNGTFALFSRVRGNYGTKTNLPESGASLRGCVCTDVLPAKVQPHGVLFLQSSVGSQSVEASKRICSVAAVHLLKSPQAYSWPANWLSPAISNYLLFCALPSSVLSSCPLRRHTFMVSLFVSVMFSHWLIIIITIISGNKCKVATTDAIYLSLIVVQCWPQVD